MKNDELIIPVYLNQRIVFDLIAMLQDGMSTVTRITSSEGNKTNDSQKYGTSFGLGQALSSLLKIDVSGERNKLTEGKAETQKSEERVHTPASLFQKLRSILIEKDKLKVADQAYSPRPGDIIEFSTSLRRNPIIHSMDIFCGLLELATAFTPPQQQSSNKKNRSNSNDLGLLKTQLMKLADEFKTGDSIDVVSDLSVWKYKAVITLEKEYLNDPSMSDLVDGHFQVAGKVIRVIDSESESVDLLRKSSMGAMKKETLQTAFSQFTNASDVGGFDVPKIEMEIKGPVIQLIPIAIFA